MRKSLAFLLIAAMLWGSVIAPARALIIAPLIPYLMGLTTAEQVALGGSVALHVVIASIALTNDGNEPAANGSNTSLQIQLDPYTPLVTPESAQPSPTSPLQPQQVVVTSGDYHYTYFHTGGSKNTCAAACDTYTASNQFGATFACTSDNAAYPSGTYVCTEYWQGNQYTHTHGTGTASGCPEGADFDGANCVKTVNSCPDGYTFNATTQSCNISNPDTQVPDQKTQIVRHNNEFLKNPNDPDPIPENLLVRPKDIVISTPERTTTVHINEDSTVTVTDIKPTANNTTTKDQVTISAPTPGNPPTVIGRNTQTYPGQESGPADPGSTSNSPIVPGTSSGSPTSPAAGTTVLNLPENLAKTEKQCGYDAAHPCKVTIDEGEAPSDFDNSARDTALDGKFDELQTFINSQDNGVGEGIQNPLIGKLPSGQCTDFVYDVTEVNPNARATIPLCEHMADIQPWTQFFAYIASAILIYGIWFRRLGGAS